MRNQMWLCALLVVAACSITNSSDCEQARNTIVKAEGDICGTSEYATSKFCRQCVDSHYYSTTGASACQCAELTFDVNACSFATGDDATAQVRSAIDWADSVCANFTPPAAIPPVADAGPGTDASVDAPTDETGADAASE